MKRDPPLLLLKRKFLFTYCTIFAGTLPQVLEQSLFLVLLFSRVPTLVSFFFLPRKKKEKNQEGSDVCEEGNGKGGGGEEEGIPAYSGQRVIPLLYQ